MNDKTLDISKFLKEVILQKAMGPILDLARMSNMGDRQFAQFQRSIKNTMYDLIKNSNEIICGYNNFSTTKDILTEAEKTKKED